MSQQHLTLPSSSSSKNAIIERLEDGKYILHIDTEQPLDFQELQKIKQAIQQEISEYNRQIRYQAYYSQKKDEILRKSREKYQSKPKPEWYCLTCDRKFKNGRGATKHSKFFCHKIDKKIIQ